MEKNAWSRRLNPEIRDDILSSSWLVGEFVLRSGEVSNRYFDKYQSLCDPDKLAEITDVMAEEIDKDTHLIAGVETGGIILATSLMNKTKLPMAVVRKQAKEYGTRKIIEGNDATGRKVVVVEDVITTGGAVLEATRQIKYYGGHVRKVLCLMFRGDEVAKQAFAEAGLTLVPLMEDSDTTGSNYPDLL